MRRFVIEGKIDFQEGEVFIETEKDENGEPLGVWLGTMLEDKIKPYSNVRIVIDVNAKIDNQLIEKISASSVEEIEDFLGYPISADILENLDDRIQKVLSQMPEEEIIKYKNKYGIFE